jgi:capsule polysaccharide modification protein KpsS
MQLIIRADALLTVQQKMVHAFCRHTPHAVTAITVHHPMNNYVKHAQFSIPVLVVTLSHSCVQQHYVFK